MEAHESGNMSYVWQSILAARPVLQEGSIWKVGDGPNINIVKDKKLPRSSTIKALFPPTSGTMRRVCNLQLLETWWWNVTLVKQLFRPEYADTILTIPLRR